MQAARRSPFRCLAMRGEDGYGCHGAKPTLVLPTTRCWAALLGASTPALSVAALASAQARSGRGCLRPRRLVAVAAWTPEASYSSHSASVAERCPGPTRDVGIAHTSGDHHVL